MKEAKGYFELVGNNIQRTLQEKGMSQQELADKMGISKQVMSKIVRGDKAINVLEISRIAKEIGGSPDSLLQIQNKNVYTHQPAFMKKDRIDQSEEHSIELLQSVIEEITMLEGYLKES